MKEFNIAATRLLISFVDENKEDVLMEINNIPRGNFNSDTIRDSENSDEVLSEDERFKAVIYANMVEGNIELFNNETDEEITDFEVEEIIDDDEDEDFDGEY